MNALIFLILAFVSLFALYVANSLASEYIDKPFIRWMNSLPAPRGIVVMLAWMVFWLFFMPSLFMEGFHERMCAKGVPYSCNVIEAQDGE